MLDIVIWSILVFFGLGAALGFVIIATASFGYFMSHPQKNRHKPHQTIHQTRATRTGIKAQKTTS